MVTTIARANARHRHRQHRHRRHRQTDRRTAAYRRDGISTCDVGSGIAYTGNPLFTGPTSNGNLAAFRSNGAPGANQITLDGSPNYVRRRRRFFATVRRGAEFKVQTNTFDAQQGYSAGATVNVAVKSGSNDLHGSAGTSIATAAVRRITSSAIAATRRGRSGTYHRFGGVLSGPVVLPGYRR